MARVNELRFLARVAHMYYLENQRQSAIAKHLHLSQATVSRMLKRALDDEIVHITIRMPSGTYADLEEGLRQKYGLPEAIVVDCSDDRPESIMARIGEGAAHLLETTLRNNEVIGVSSWSETILKMVENIHPMKQVKAKYVVQTLGGMGNPSVQTHATQLTTRLAQLTGAMPLLLSAQGVVSSREAKLILFGDPYVRETTNQFSKITLALVGIGAVEPSEMLARSGNVFSEQELTQLSQEGAVGNIGLRFLNSTGEVVKTPLDDRVMGIGLEELKKIDRVIGLAGGDHKTLAIRSTLLAGLLDVLITDRFTAERLLDIEPEPQNEAF